MADITRELNNIKSARYGSEVRDSIHDGIKKINDVVEQNSRDTSEAVAEVTSKAQEVDSLIQSVEATMATIPNAISEMQTSTSEAINSMETASNSKISELNTVKNDTVAVKEATEQARLDTVEATEEARRVIQGASNIDDTTPMLTKSYSSQKVEDTFVKKVTGKELSSNDYTTTEKDKLANFTENEAGELLYKGAEIGGKVTVDSALSDTSENPVQNKVVSALSKDIIKSVHWSEVAKPITAGTYVTHKGYMWECLVDNSVEPTDADVSNWKKHSLDSVVNTLNSNLATLNDNLTNLTNTIQNKSNNHSNIPIDANFSKDYSIGNIYGAHLVSIMPTADNVSYWHYLGFFCRTSMGIILLPICNTPNLVISVINSGTDVIFKLTNNLQWGVYVNLTLTKLM